MDEILAWSFLPRDARWRKRDPWGERLLLTAGKAFHAADMFEMRRRHLDAWEQSLDALRHAPGLVVCRVHLAGRIEREGYPRYYIVHGGESVRTRRGMLRFLPSTYEGVGWVGRLYASEYHVLWTADVTLLIHHFACDLAGRALVAERAAGREPDERVWQVLAARWAWLAGNLHDAGLRTAWRAFDTAMNEHWRRNPPKGEPEYTRWWQHAYALYAVKYAAEPVPLAAGQSLINVKRAIGYGRPWIAAMHDEQERRIATLAAWDEAVSEELAQRLNDSLVPTAAAEPF